MRCERRRSAAGRREGPVEPGAERLDVGGVDGGAAPDAQARRRVAVAGDVVGDALGLEELGHALDEVALARLVERRDLRVDDPQADRGVRARRRVGDEVLDPRGPVDPGLQRREVGVGAGAGGGEAADPFHPVERVDRVGDGEHRGGVDRLAGEDAVDELAALGEAEDLRQRPRRGVALQPLDGARAEDQHAVAALAAHRLLPGEGGDVELVPRQTLREGGRGGVAEGQAGAVGGDPVAVRHAGAGGGAVPGEADVGLGPHRREVGQVAVGRGQHPAVVELQLLGRVGRPALAEALPDQHVDGPGAEHRPHRHLEGAGVGGGHDADAVVGRHAEQARGAVDHVLELRLRLRGAVRAAEEGAGGDRLGGPARALGAGARGELGTCGSDGGFHGRRDDRGGGGLAHRPFSVVRAMFLSAPRSPSSGTRPRPA